MSIPYSNGLILWARHNVDAIWRECNKCDIGGMTIKWASNCGAYWNPGVGSTRGARSRRTLWQMSADTLDVPTIIYDIYIYVAHVHKTLGTSIRDTVQAPSLLSINSNSASMSILYTDDAISWARHNVDVIWRECNRCDLGGMIMKWASNYSASVSIP